MYSEFEYYLNNILFVFVFGHNSEPKYYSYSYSAKYFCTNIIRIRIRSFWKNEYYSYSYSVKILMPNIIRIRIRSKKQYSLTSETDRKVQKVIIFCHSSDPKLTFLRKWSFLSLTCESEDKMWQTDRQMQKYSFFYSQKFLSFCKSKVFSWQTWSVRAHHHYI